MGEFLSCLRQIWRPQKLPREDSDDQKAGFATWIIRAMKPRCFYALEEEKQKQLHTPQFKERTLGEWLLVSPEYVVNSYSYDEDYDTVESIAIIMKKLLEFDNENADEGDQNSKGKIKKKVSFKLPEETDVLIFYASDSE